MYVSNFIPIYQLANYNFSQNTAWALAILQTILHVLTVIMALYALFKPDGSFKDHSADAAQVLADGQATDTKIQTDFGPPAKK